MLQSKYVKTNINPSQTDSSIISAKDGTIFRVVGGFVVAGGTAVNVTFNSKGTGAGTAISSLIQCGVNGGLIFPSVMPARVGEAPYGYFQTSKGEGLSATTGSGSTVGITLVYVEIS